MSFGGFLWRREPPLALLGAGGGMREPGNSVCGAARRTAAGNWALRVALGSKPVGGWGEAIVDPRRAGIADRRSSGAGERGGLLLGVLNRSQPFVGSLTVSVGCACVPCRPGTDAG